MNEFQPEQQEYRGMVCCQSCFLLEPYYVAPGKVLGRHVIECRCGTKTTFCIWNGVPILVTIQKPTLLQRVRRFFAAAIER